MTAEERIERKLDALALGLGGPCRREFDRIGWTTKTNARKSLAARKRYNEPAGAEPKVVEK